jgi:hypothetical protein
VHDKLRRSAICNKAKQFNLVIEYIRTRSEVNKRIQFTVSYMLQAGEWEWLRALCKLRSQVRSLRRLEVPSLLLLWLRRLLLRVDALRLRLCLHVRHVLLADLLLQMRRKILEVGQIGVHAHHHVWGHPWWPWLLLCLLKLSVLTRRRCSRCKGLLQAKWLHAKVRNITSTLLWRCKVGH